MFALQGVGMDWKILGRGKGLKGEVVVPPDKSISHRAVMFGAIARGECRVDNFLFSEDCVATLEAFRSMGIEIVRDDNSLIVRGKGLNGLVSSPTKLYLGNSGTSMRIISGILVGQDFQIELIGDESLSNRPMRRIIDPLTLMRADIRGEKDGLPPLKIIPSKEGLLGIDYVSPVASAQVKSSILAAGLYASGQTVVTEPFQSRDHTERMLKYFSADIKTVDLTTTIKGGKELSPKDIHVPGDVSSAAFFIVAALIIGGSEIYLRNVGFNSTRTGLISVLDRMGAKIEIENHRSGEEPTCDMRISSSRLKGTIVEKEELPLLIDEVPIMIIAALKAEGRTVISGISELKVKETDRVKTMKDNLVRLGADVAEKDDSLIIEGGVGRFDAAELNSFGDHRIAMSMAVAALNAEGESVIKNIDCARTSYPKFIEDLEKLQ